MPKKTPPYAPEVQRHAVDQVLHHHRPIVQVARQLTCSPQSVKNWIDKHHKSSPTPSLVPSTSLPSSLTFLPIQVEHPTLPSAKIELVTKNGLTLRFPGETTVQKFKSSADFSAVEGQNESKSRNKKRDVSP